MKRKGNYLNNLKIRQMVMALVMVCLIGLYGCEKDNTTEENTISQEKQTEVNDISSDSLSSLYENRMAFDNAVDFTGEWKKTNTHSELGGDITISSQNDSGFEFEGSFFYYSHSGELSGTAYFVSENVAIFKQEPEEWNVDGEPAYVGFVLEDEKLEVHEAGFVSGMGMNVSASGEYAKGLPVYTNANILKDTFSDAELKSIRELLGAEEYEDYFVNDTECGVIIAENRHLQDGVACRYIECFVPTMGGFMGYSMVLAEDGRIYYYHVDGTFFTNDESYVGTEMPKTE